MRTLISTEFLKLRTIRSPWLVLLAAPVVVIAGVSGLVVSGGDVHKPTEQSGALAHVGLVSLCALVFGLLAVAGEYRHKTITDTYLGTPRRDRIIAAKLVVYTAIGAVSGVVASVVGLAAAAAWWSGKGAGFDWSNGDMWATIVGGIGWNAAFAAVGVGLGALVRSLVGAVALALAWIALVEGIVGQLLGDFGRWLPFNAGRALGGSAATPSSDLLPRWGGGVVLAVYAVLFAVVAVRTTVRRDVA